MVKRNLEVIGSNGEYLIWDHVRKQIIARCYGIQNASLVRAALARLK